MSDVQFMEDDIGMKSRPRRDEPTGMAAFVMRYSFGYVKDETTARIILLLLGVGMIIVSMSILLSRGEVAEPIPWTPPPADVLPKNTATL